MNDPGPLTELEEAHALHDHVVKLRRISATVPTPPGIDDLMERWRAKYGDEVVKNGATLGKGEPGETHYYSRDPGRLVLFRARWEPDALWLERLDAGRWIFDPEILDRFTRPDFDLVDVAEDEARRIGGSPLPS